MQYLQKSMGYEIDFLPAGKHKNVPQIDIIILCVHSQACPKHPKQLVYNIFAISQGNVKDEVDFCLLIIVKGFLKVTYTIILDARGQGCPNYPK